MSARRLATSGPWSATFMVDPMGRWGPVWRGDGWSKGRGAFGAAFAAKVQYSCWRGGGGGLAGKEIVDTAGVGYRDEGERLAAYAIRQRLHKPRGIFRAAWPATLRHRLPSAVAQRIRVCPARLSESSEIPRRRAPMGELARRMRPIRLRIGA